MDGLRQVLAGDSHIDYALLFGSRARGSSHASSDLDIAVGLAAGARFTPMALGDLVSRLEQASGATVDLLILDEAPPAVAYRVFRDGCVVFDRNPAALAARKARAVLEYLDFRPLEQLVADGVLAAAARGR